MQPKHLVYLFFLNSLLIFSQSYHLKGRVLDEKNVPIAFANVVLEIPESNKISCGTTTNEKGYFEFNDLKGKSYVLKISFLGYDDFEKRIELDKDLVIETITLIEKTENLDGVVVTAKRPTIRRMVDRLVFNVENSTLSNNNVLDVLKHTPGVIVSGGSISVKNATPVVYINDRRVHLSMEEVQQLLEATPANNIKSIEVITNPPAKYEAEGGAVLNIKTSKNIISGYHGSIFGNFKQGPEFPKYSFGTSHFFKTKKLSTYINYNISPKKNYRNNLEDINFINNNTITSSWNTDLRRTHKSANQNMSATINYDFNDFNSLNFSANTLFAPRKVSKIASNSLTKVFGANKALDSTFRTFNNSVLEKFNLAFSLGYTHKFKNEGEKISVDVHHTNYDYSDFQDVNTGYFLPNANTSFRDNKFQTFSEQNIELITGQIDYKLPTSDNSLFEAGSKISKIDSDNILNQFVFENGIKTDDLENSDTFLYNEMNYAGYLSFETKWENWNLKAGLRVEHTETEGRSLSTNTLSNNSYTNLFPSFYILNSLNSDDDLYFSYNKRIYRPRYRQLNPFKYFLNDNAFVTGDPNLLPEIDDNFILGYTINDTYTFELYYRYEKNPTLELPFLDNDSRILKHTFTNIDNNVSYGLDFTTYTEIVKDWNLYILSSFFYYENNFFALEGNNELLKNDKWSVYANIINYFSFLEDKSLTADLSVDFIGPVVIGPSDISSRLGVYINVNKTLWKNRASISIGVQDIFNTRSYTQTTKYANQDLFIASNFETRLFTFGFNYKFGNYRLKEKKETIDLNERDRLEKD
ncbi:outer membrane beta-barrel protein [Algibacter sp. 2305UL17-15]|uniref:outer membrane beta-barrel protein n=1 Tax=Algibacter sp. 2305UL17-15 TaxID=3231268 RepID=UPI0034583761